jgi:butyrate kinase
MASLLGLVALHDELERLALGTWRRREGRMVHLVTARIDFISQVIVQSGEDEVVFPRTLSFSLPIR